MRSADFPDSARALEYRGIVTKLFAQFAGFLYYIRLLRPPLCAAVSDV